MNKIKKLSMTIGTLATVSVPTAFIISCGNDDEGNDETKFDFAADLAKIKTSTSSKIKATLSSAVGAKNVGDAVTPAALGFAPALSSGVTVAYVVQTAYEPSSGAIIVTATLTKGSETSSPQDITITAKVDPFDFADDLAKIKTSTSTKVKTALNSAVGAKNVGDAVTPAALGFAPALSSGVTVAYVVQTAYEPSSGVIVVTASLTKGSETSTPQDITITAKADPFDFAADLAKIKTSTSTKVKTALNSAVGAKNVGDAVTPAALGFAPALSSGVMATYVVQTAYEPSSRVIVVTATLTKGSETSAPQDITITAKADPFDFAADLAKIKTSTSTKVKTALNSAVGAKNVGDAVTPAALGFAPALSSGVMATYVVQTAYEPSSGVIVVTATLTKGSETSAPQDITITAKTYTFDFADDLAKTISGTSIKTRRELTSVVDTKGVGDAVTSDELGITVPSWLRVSYAVKIAYNSGTGVIVVTATFTRNGILSLSKELTILAEPFGYGISEYYGAGWYDRSTGYTVSSKSAIELEKAVKEKQINASITAAKLGILEPILKWDNVEISYIVKTPFKTWSREDDNHNENIIGSDIKVMITVTLVLKKNGETQVTRDIMIGAK